jgi:hypothetical protein
VKVFFLREELLRRDIEVGADSAAGLAPANRAFGNPFWLIANFTAGSR